MTSRKTAQLDRWMNPALKMRKENQRDRAIAFLLTHEPALKRVAAGAGLLATLYFESNEYRNAAKWYATAAGLAPRSEMASLGLFHSLWEIGKPDQALAEMRRFLGVSESKEYTRLLKGLREELLPSTGPRGRHAQGGGVPAKLSIDDRVSVNMAEHAGLAWRQTDKLVGIPELQNA